MNRHLKSGGLALLATLCWATVASAFKLTLRLNQGDVTGMVFWSALVSWCVFLGVLIARKGERRFFQMGGTDLARSILMGLLNPAIYYLVLFKAYDLLPGQQAQPLNYTWPIVLTLLSAIVLRAKIRPIDFVALAISFAGVVIISHGRPAGNPGGTHMYGVVLALGSSLIWATYWIVNLKDSRDSVVKLFWSFLFGLCGLALWITLTGQWTFPGGRQVFGILWIGVFEMGLTFILWMRALEIAPNPGRAANIVYLSPFLSLFLLNKIVGEQLASASVIGLILIVMGIWIQTLKRSTEN